MSTFTTSPPELLQTFLVDNNEEKIQTTYKDKTNRIAFEKWFSKLDESSSWLNENVSLSLRVLKIISQECEPEEFFAVQKICDVFRESLLFKNSEKVQLNQIANEFLNKFFIADPYGFENYLKTTNELGCNPLHIAFYAGDLELTSFVEHFF